MKINPRKPFAGIIFLLDVINPYVIIVSVVGLALEFTPAYPAVASVNTIIDIFFVFDFLLRLAAYPFGTYIIGNYGWVDFLASIPVLSWGFQFVSLFQISKIIKLIGLLRLLRVCGFIRKMWKDSAYIQERLMKIVVSAVFVGISGLFFFDACTKTVFRENETTVFIEKYRNVSQNLDVLMEQDSNIVLQYKNGTIRTRDGSLIRSKMDYSAIVNNFSHYLIEIGFDDDFVYAEGMIWVPKCGILLDSPGALRQYNMLMFVLVLMLISVLFVLIFYIGAVLSSDMCKVQLIVDSVDADDYLLLANETSKYRVEGVYKVVPGEDELDNLMRMTGKIIEKNHLDSDLHILDFELDSLFGDSAEDDAYKLPDLESFIDDSDMFTLDEADFETIAAKADENEFSDDSFDPVTLDEKDFIAIPESHATLTAFVNEDEIKPLEAKNFEPVQNVTNELVDVLEELDIPDIAELEAEERIRLEEIATEESVECVFAAENAFDTEIEPESAADSFESVTIDEADFVAIPESHASLTAFVDEDEIKPIETKNAEPEQDVPSASVPADDNFNPVTLEEADFVAISESHASLAAFVDENEIVPMETKKTASVENVPDGLVKTAPARRSGLLAAAQKREDFIRNKLL